MGIKDNYGSKGLGARDGELGFGTDVDNKDSPGSKGLGVRDWE